MQKQENQLNPQNLYYSSTRNSSEQITSSQAIVNGIAGDGGLYVPSSIPSLDSSFEELIKMDYRQLACYIIGKFLPEFTEEELKTCGEKAYD